MEQICHCREPVNKEITFHELAADYRAKTERMRWSSSPAAKVQQGYQDAHSVQVAQATYSQIIHSLHDDCLHLCFYRSHFVVSSPPVLNDELGLTSTSRNLVVDCPLLGRVFFVAGPLISVFTV